MDKRYTPKTFGMRYKDFSPILASQVRLTKNCKGYETFREEVKILRETRSGCGKASIDFYSEIFKRMRMFKNYKWHNIKIKHTKLLVQVS